MTNIERLFENHASLFNDLADKLEGAGIPVDELQDVCRAYHLLQVELARRAAK